MVSAGRTGSDSSTSLSSRWRVYRALCLLLLLGLTMAAAGCAPSLKRVAVSEEAAKAEREKQLELTFSVLVKRYDRVYNVSYPLLVAAAQLCKNATKPTYGFMLHDRELYRKIYGKEYEKIAVRLYGAGKEVTVRYVHPQLPAARAGLRVGDGILSINGKRLRKKSALEAMKLLDRLNLSEDRPLLLSIEREGKVKELAIYGVPACRYSLHLVRDDVVNAAADGSRVFITTGMMRFAETDEELAVIVGHEIAHNALGHLTKLNVNVWLGSLLDRLIYSTTGADTQWVFARLGGMVFSQAFEAEADYAGLYIVARAGYDITDAPNSWRRIAVEYPSSIRENFTSSHPSTPERFTALEETVREIEEKRRRGEPLQPEKKR